uniref:Uncharacterized protein n=1 Tax=Arundo donax TaxID=35708 RepID=A0A0A9AGR3_ARUDO
MDLQLLLNIHHHSCLVQSQIQFYYYQLFASEALFGCIQCFLWNCLAMSSFLRRFQRCH